MKHWKCRSCHHEWDGNDLKCDWCGGDGDVISEIPSFALKLLLEAVHKKAKRVPKPMR